MSTTLDRALFAGLKGEISGSVLGPQDPGYDAARAVHNGLVDRRPAVIVRCRTTNDVVAALAFARRTGLEVSVRGGGHNVAGRAVSEGGVMIDLAEMKAIAVDPDRAIATAEGGVLWGELNDTAAEHGLAVTGGAVSGTGIAGYTLGGGLGWLMAKYGLGADNLVAVELVTAEGDILRRRLCRRTPISSGRFAAAAELRHRDVVHVPAAPGRDDRRRADRPPVRRCARDVSLLPRRGGGRLGRSDRLRRARARPGRLRRQARGAGRLPRGRRRTRRSATSHRSRRGARLWSSRSGRCRTR